MYERLVCYRFGSPKKQMNCVKDFYKTKKMNLAVNVTKIAFAMVVVLRINIITQEISKQKSHIVL